MNIAHHSSPTAWLLAILVGWSLPLSAAETDGVDAGRKALQESWHYPWYDSDKDSLRRIHVQPDLNASSTTAPATPSARNGGFTVTNILVLIIAALGLGVLVFVLGRSYLRQESFPAHAVSTTSRSGAAFDPARVEALPFDITSGSNDLLGEVRKRINQGDFAQAVVYLFSYQLLELDRHHLIRLAKGKTNRQYLRELAQRRRELREVVEPTMVACEDAFFGNHAIQRARFEACWNRLEEFGRLVAGTP